MNIYFCFQFPSLCSQYFKLITFLAEINPEKFASIPHELFKNLMASIELGLNAYPFNRCIFTPIEIISDCI